MTETVIKNKLVIKDLGNPSMVKTIEGEKAKHVLGTIFGIATGVKRRADRVDPTRMNEMLVGDFEGIPADGKSDTIRSGVLYLPEGIFNMIASQLEGENANASVQFALEVASVKAPNPAGYTWAVTPRVKAESGDPLAALREQVHKALSAPEKAKK